jgi:hypothetical protein
VTTLPVVPGRSPAWDLFADWCAANRRCPLPADADTLAAFTAAVPAATSTQAGRLRVLRRVHHDAGHRFPDVGQDRDGDSQGRRRVRLWRTGPDWLTLPDALTAIDTAGWPAGQRGRRDAFLLVLAARTCLTRRDLRRLRPADLGLSGPAGSPPESGGAGGDPGRRDTPPGTTITVADATITATDHPGACQACASTRWLRTAALAHHRSRAAVREHFLRPPQHHEGTAEPLGMAGAGHDCARPVDPGWREAWQLLPAIDQHGWITDWRPMSTRAITAVIAARQTTTSWNPPVPAPPLLAGPTIEQPRPEGDDGPPPPSRPGRWDDTTTDDLLRLLDEHTDAADEILGRIDTALATGAGGHQ